MFQVNWVAADEDGLTVNWTHTKNIAGRTVTGDILLTPTRLRALAAAERAVGSPHCDVLAALADEIDPDQPQHVGLKTVNGRPVGAAKRIVETWAECYADILGDRVLRHEKGIKGNAPHTVVEAVRRGAGVPAAHSKHGPRPATRPDIVPDVPVVEVEERGKGRGNPRDGR